MRVLIDTNVLIDHIAQREPFCQNARKIILACAKKTLSGCMTAQSVADAYYILRKNVDESERRRILLYLCNILTVMSVRKSGLVSALQNKAFSDFEDCLQSGCAAAFHADYIITRNEKDFAVSPIPAISPETFCKHFLTEGKVL